MKNKMVDVRNHLVAALEALSDPDSPMDVTRAKAISDVAQTYINAVKVEVDALAKAGIEAVPEAVGQGKPALEHEGA